MDREDNPPRKLRDIAYAHGKAWGFAWDVPGEHTATALRRWRLLLCPQEYPARAPSRSAYSAAGQESGRDFLAELSSNRAHGIRGVAPGTIRVAHCGGPNGLHGYGTSSQDGGHQQDHDFVEKARPTHTAVASWTHHFYDALPNILIAPWAKSTFSWKPSVAGAADRRAGGQKDACGMRWGGRWATAAIISGERQLAAQAVIRVDQDDIIVHPQMGRRVRRPRLPNHQDETFKADQLDFADSTPAVEK